MTSTMMAMTRKIYLDISKSKLLSYFYRGNYLIFSLDVLIILVLSSQPFFKIAMKPLGLLGNSLVEVWTNQERSRSLCK